MISIRRNVVDSIFKLIRMELVVIEERKSNILIDIFFLIQNAFQWEFQFLSNGVFAVDTFFLMSGLLVAFTQLRELDQNKGFFNLKKFYVRRYMRYSFQHFKLREEQFFFFKFLCSTKGSLQYMRQYWPS